MTTLFLTAACALLLNLAVGMWRVLRGPIPADRMLGSQLFGTTAVAILLLLGAAYDAPAFQDTALVFAILAPLAAVAFVRRAWAAWQEESRGDH